jgi:hypothetical protein
MRRWLEDYGFAVLVLVELAIAGWLAAMSALPSPVPDYALQSGEIYRLEIGAASFIALYLASMALVLALYGRGFVELGPSGMRAAEVSGRHGQQDAWTQQKTINEDLQRQLETLQFAFKAADKRLIANEERLNRLEGDE